MLRHVLSRGSTSLWGSSLRRTAPATTVSDVAGSGSGGGRHLIQHSRHLDHPLRCHSASLLSSLSSPSLSSSSSSRNVQASLFASNQLTTTTRSIINFNSTINNASTSTTAIHAMRLTRTISASAVRNTNDTAYDDAWVAKQWDLVRQEPHRSMTETKEAFEKETHHADVAKLHIEALARLERNDDALAAAERHHTAVQDVQGERSMDRMSAAWLKCECLARVGRVEEVTELASRTMVEMDGCDAPHDDIIAFKVKLACFNTDCVQMFPPGSPQRSHHIGRATSLVQDMLRQPWAHVESEDGDDGEAGTPIFSQAELELHLCDAKLTLMAMPVLATAGATIGDMERAKGERKRVADEALERLSQLPDSLYVVQLLRGEANMAKEVYYSAIDNYTKQMEIQLEEAKEGQVDYSFHVNLQACYLNRALCYMQESMKECALEDFNTVLELEGPNEEAAHFNIGVIHMNARDYHDALTAFDNALKINPNRPNAFMARAKCYEALGKKDEMKAELEKMEILQRQAVFSLRGT